MSPDGEGAPLEACANRIGQGEPRLEVGARVGGRGEGRGILALNNWEGKAAPGGGWQRLGFGGPPPSPSGAACAVSQLRWQLASPGHLAPWSKSQPLWADGFGKCHLPLLHGLRTQLSVTFLSISALWLAGGWALPLPPRRFCGFGGVCLTPNSAWRPNSGDLRLLPPPHK